MYLAAPITDQANIMSPTTYKLTPFSGNTPTSAELSLGQDAAKKIFNLMNGSHKAEMNVGIKLGHVAIDNPWLVEILGDVHYGSRSGSLIGLLIRSNLSTDDPVEVLGMDKIARWLIFAVVASPYIEQHRVQTGPIWSIARHVPFLIRESGEFSSIEVEATILSLHVASLRRLSDAGEESRRIATSLPDTSYLLDRWQDIQSIVPELIIRRTLDQEVIDLLLESEANVLLDGEL